MSEGTSGGPLPAEAAKLRAGAVIVAMEASRDGGTDAKTVADVLWTPVAGAPLLAWSVRAFEAAAGVAENVIVVATAERLVQARELAKRERWRKTRAVIAGGPRWRDAVRAGLDPLPPTCEWVIVHEAARPLVTPELIAAGLAAARAEGGAGAAAAYEAVNETIKRVRDGVVVETPARADLALLQTPQIFRRALLEEANGLGAEGEEGEGATDKDKDEDTDEVTRLLRRGLRVALFLGGHENVRVTGPEGLEIVEAALLRRRAGT